jgi:rRNA maturation RNase YbeY
MEIKLVKQARKPRLKNRTRLIEVLTVAATESGLSRSVGDGPEVVEVILVTAATSRRLNFTYLKHDYPTDVLAFDLGPSVPRLNSDDETVHVRAEIYICPAVARQASTQYSTSENYEIVLYAVHGMLHLTGRHNDRGERARSAMKDEEARIMKILQKQFDIRELFDN